MVCMQLLQQLLLQRLLLLLLQLHGWEVGAGELHALACMHAGLIPQDNASFAVGSSPRLLLLMLRCVATIAMTPDMARHGQQKACCSPQMSVSCSSIGALRACVTSVG